MGPRARQGDVEMVAIGFRWEIAVRFDDVAKCRRLAMEFAFGVGPLENGSFGHCADSSCENGNYFHAVESNSECSFSRMTK